MRAVRFIFAKKIASGALFLSKFDKNNDIIFY